MAMSEQICKGFPNNSQTYRKFLKNKKNRNIRRKWKQYGEILPDKKYKGWDF
jgi:hypothetical protein